MLESVSFVFSTKLRTYSGLARKKITSGKSIGRRIQGQITIKRGVQRRGGLVKFEMLSSGPIAAIHSFP